MSNKRIIIKNIVIIFYYNMKMLFLCSHNTSVINIESFSD